MPVRYPTRSSSSGTIPVSSVTGAVAKTTGTLTYYINSATGNDSTGTGTALLPWQTFTPIKSVLNVPEVIENDIVVNASGTFAEDFAFSRIGLSVDGSGAHRSKTLTINGDISELVAEQTATAGTTTTLTVSGAAWTVDAWRGNQVQFLSGGIYNAIVGTQALEPYAVIESNTADTITFGNITGVTGGVTDHFRIIKPNTGWTSSAYAIAIKAETDLNIYIRNISFNSGSFAVYILGGSDLKVSNCKFNGSLGISMSRASHFQAISGCDFSGLSMSQGIAISGSAGWIGGCYFHDAPSLFAIEQVFGGSTNLSGNVVDGTTYGFYCNDGALVAVTGNIVKNTTGAAVWALTGKGYLSIATTGMSGSGNTIVYKGTRGSVIKGIGTATGTTLMSLTGDSSVYDEVANIVYKSQSLALTGKIGIGLSGAASNGNLEVADEGGITSISTSIGATFNLNNPGGGGSWFKLRSTGSADTLGAGYLELYDFGNGRSIYNIAPITGNLTWNSDSRVIGRRRGDSASITAANDLTLGITNLNLVSGNTQINAITTTGWGAGDEVVLIMLGTPTIKHNTAGGAGTAPLLLDGSADIVAAANTVLTLIFDGTNWQQKSLKAA